MKWKETVVRRGRGRGASRRQQIEEDLEYPMDNENEYEEDEFLVGDDAVRGDSLDRGVYCSRTFSRVGDRVHG